MTDEQRPLDPRGRPIPRAALAPNWWQVLLADAAIGALVVAVGIAIAWWWIPWVGVLVVCIGVIYLLLIARRGLQWRWLRREADRA